MANNQRPPIPAAIKREVRKRCGFGCVICGMPLYEYEHMLEWAKVRRHVASEITLLCRQHHGEKTNGLLPKENVIRANRSPYNLKEGVSKNHFLHYSGKNIQIALANNILLYNNLRDNDFISALIVDGMPVVGFRKEDDRLLLQFIAFNEFNIPVLQIVDNELRYVTEQWDIEWEGQKLTIREGQGKILLRLVFEPPHSIRITNGRILRNGIELLIGNDFVFCSNSRIFINGHKTVNCLNGLSIGDSMQPLMAAAAEFSKIPRYEIDRKAARQFLRKSIRKVRSSSSNN